MDGGRNVGDGDGEHSSSVTDGLPIHLVSDLLGVPAPTLRSWERRYGLPLTARSAGGHRRYSPVDLEQLRLMRDEVARGRAAADAAANVRLFLRQPETERIADFLAASRRMDPDALRSALDAASDELGLGVTLDSVLMPSMRQIGTWWATGRCDVGREHFTTEVVRGWLASRTALAPSLGQVPPILLACGPRDLHTLGLEALATLLAHQQRSVRMLGGRTPQRTLVTATTATEASAVVLVSHLPSHRRPAVEALRALAGTGCPVYYAGNAFLFPAARAAVPGTYLGENLAEAAALLRDATAG